MTERSAVSAAEVASLSMLNDTGLGAGVQRKERVRSLIANCIFYFFAVMFAVVFFYPIWQMIIGAFSTVDQVYSPKVYFFPNPLHWNWGAMMALMTQPSFVTLFLNTVKLALAAVPLIFFSSLGAFGLARLRARGKQIVFVGILAVMMLPGAVTMIPTFILFKNLGWVNTYLPFYVPTIAGSPFYIFLLRQFMMTIPREMDESARVDGCNNFRIYWSIILPLCKPALAASFIFAFIDRWNDYLGPLIYFSQANRYPLSVGIVNAVTVTGNELIQWQVMMFAALLATLPLLIIFFSFQKYFVKGVVMSGVKG